MYGTKAELEVQRVLRDGGNLPELRALGLSDESLLNTLRSLESRGIVDAQGRLV